MSNHVIPAKAGIHSITYFILFFLPFIVFPSVVFFFEPPKVLVFELAVELLLLLNLLNYGFRPKFTKTNLLLAGLFLLTFFDLLILRGPDSFFGNAFRLQGIFLLWNLIFFSILSKNIKIDQKYSILPLISIILLLLTIPVFGGNASQRAVGSLGEPNALAAAAIFIWPFALLKFTNRLSKFIPPILAFLIIFISGSRSGILAFVIQLTFLSLNRIKSKALNKIFVTCLILIAFSLILPLVEGGGWFENRSEVWQTALEAGLRSPIFGSGFGNIENSLHSTSQTLNNNVQYQVVDSSHNLFLDFWVQGGIIGLGLLVGLMFYSIRSLIAKKDSMLLTAFLGLLAVMSFNPVSVVSLAAFWYLLGQGMKDDFSLT